MRPFRQISQETYRKRYHKPAEQRPVVKPPICDECGENYADPPSKLCPGCQAYREHQQ